MEPKHTERSWGPGEALSPLGHWNIPEASEAAPRVQRGPMEPRALYPPIRSYSM